MEDVVTCACIRLTSLECVYVAWVTNYRTMVSRANQVSMTSLECVYGYVC